LDLHAARFPERVAIKTVEEALTYGDLRAQVERCAVALHAMGLKAGDRVAVLSPPRIEAFVTFLAAARLGLIWLGLNPKYQLPEFEYILNDAGPKIVFGVDGFDGRSYGREIASLRVTGTVEKWIGFSEAVHYDISFVDWVQHGESPDDDYAAAVQAVTRESPALLVYTSGSSGRPKGVLLGHRAMLQRSRTQLEQYPALPFPTVVNPFPINHIGGMHFVSMYAFVGGGTLFYCEKFGPELIVTLMERREINVMVTIPTMLHLITRCTKFKPELLNSLTWLYFSGAAMPPDLMEMLFQSKCGVGLTYGMTETCGSVTYCKADRVSWNSEQMTATIGWPVPDGEVRVVDRDGNVCRPGESGEIQVRAEFCMNGYLNREEATREAFTVDGWMKTGDLANVREDGCLEFAGRLSEMFKSGGYNVYPREIEMALESHPDVAITAVVPVADTVFGEVGCAFVVPRSSALLTEDGLRDWCRSILANYKVPKRFIVTTEFPLLAVGKVDKMKLRQMAAAATA